MPAGTSIPGCVAAIVMGDELCLAVSHHGGGEVESELLVQRLGSVVGHIDEEVNIDVERGHMAPPSPGGCLPTLRGALLAAEGRSTRSARALGMARRFYRSGAGARSLTEVVATGIKKLEPAEEAP